MADLRSTTATFEAFKKAFAAGDSEKTASLLGTLKVAVTQFPALPPLFEQTPTAQQELMLARELLEHAVLFSVHQQDEAAFERNFLQLRSYYTDTRHMLPLSPQEYLITGLNLLRLLVQNRIAEFHTELEVIPAEAHGNPYIKHSIELEQFLTEGAYNKIVSAKSDLPDPAYGYFMTKLMETVRDEIASCIEKAYAHLSLDAAHKLLSMESPAALQQYVAQREWMVQGSDIKFREEKTAPSTTDIPSMQIINQTLMYAKELERIV